MMFLLPVKLSIAEQLKKMVDPDMNDYTLITENTIC